MISINGKVQMDAIFNEKRKNATMDKYPLFLSQEELRKVRKFHKTLTNYKPTPLVKLDNLAKDLGIKSIFVKDESKRNGLNSFKVLGGSYAVAKLLCNKLGIDIEDVTFDDLKSNEVREKMGQVTFATCSDGNHGKAVAWSAKELGHKAIIYLPKGTVKRRVDAIKELRAEAIVTDMNYDDTVRYVAKKSRQNKWEIVQDTAWEGYAEIPEWIMQGYSTMGNEAIDQLKDLGIGKPTHIFLQAGVGAMAGSILGCYANLFNGEHPITGIIEPNNAACMFKSAMIDDGRPHVVGGDLETIMAGLACGEPISMGWDILRDFAHMFITCPDYVTARGIRILANPIGEDKKIVSGESGAVGVGLLSLLMELTELKEIKSRFGLNKNSIVLIFSTEGDTDPVNYRKIIWDGKYQTPAF